MLSTNFGEAGLLCYKSLLFKSDICNIINNKNYIKKLIIDVKCITIKIIK